MNVIEKIKENDALPFENFKQGRASLDETSQYFHIKIFVVLLRGWSRKSWPIR